MKTVLLIADGMGDWPLRELGGKTPMQVADTPNMDKMASQGIVGVCRTVPKGLLPGSDVANMSLLGFDPQKFHTGRGPIEAAARDISLWPEDIVWRLNLVTLTAFAPDGIMQDFTGGNISTEESLSLITELQGQLGSEAFTFVPCTRYRHLLIQRGAADSGTKPLEITPPHDLTGSSISSDFAEFGKVTPLFRLLQQASEILEKTKSTSKANAIWPWGQGRRLALPSFRETFGCRGAVVSAVDLIKGLGRAAGMDVLNVPGATGLLDTDYDGKVEAALAHLERHDFVLIHVEAPDECAHAGCFESKVEAISCFDRRIAGPMLEALQAQDVRFAVTCDHLTPTALRTHHDSPVPFLVFRNGERHFSNVTGFNEHEAAKSGLRIEKGHEFLPWILSRCSLKPAAPNPTRVR